MVSATYLTQRADSPAVGSDHRKTFLPLVPSPMNPTRAPRKLSLLDCFGCCLGGDENYGNDLEPLTRGGIGAHREQQLNDSLGMDLARAQQARRALYSTLGHLHDFSIDEMDEKLTKWPVLSNPRFRLIHRAASKTIILVSDGLSDPFDDAVDANVNGFGMEFYVETPVSEISLDVAEIKKSWQFKLLSTVSNMAATHGGIRQIVDSLAVLSTEAEGVADAINPETRNIFSGPDNRVGALIGLSDDRPMPIPDYINDMPLTTVKLVNIKLIHLSELAVIVNRGAEGRAQLANLFAENSAEKTVRRRISLCSRIHRSVIPHYHTNPRVSSLGASGVEPFPQPRTLTNSTCHDINARDTL